MGAHNAEASFDGTLTRQQLHKAYDAYIEQLTVEYGTDPYNGTLSTTRGLIISDYKAKTYQEAVNYALDHTNKWEAAMAVWCENQTTVRKLFTFGGNQSNEWQNPPIRKVFKKFGDPIQYEVADQLNKTEGAKLLKTMMALDTLAVTAHKLRDTLAPMLKQLDDPQVVKLDGTFFTALKKASAEFRKVAAKRDKAQSDLDAQFKALKDKYSTATTKKDKPLWVVAGWAAC